MIAVQKLEVSHDLSSFDSGNRDLDKWVRRHGLGNQLLYGVTYVAVDDGGGVVGFVTVSPTSVERAMLGGQGGPGKWPALLLGRMAVATSYQKHGIGSRYLLKHVFELAAQLHLTVGCSAIVVDAKPGAVRFYAKYGFLTGVVIDQSAPGSTDHTTMMYISIKTVLGLMEL